MAKKKLRKKAKSKVVKKKQPKGTIASKKRKKAKVVKKTPKRDPKTGRFLKKAKPKPVTPKRKKAVKKTAKRKVVSKAKKPAKRTVLRQESKALVPARTKPYTSVRKPKSVRAPSKVKFVRLGRFGHGDYVTASHLVTDNKNQHFKNFSWSNRTDIDPILPIVFDNAMDGHLRKMSLEWDDLRIFGYGVLFRPDGHEITPSLISEVAIMLQGYHASIVVGEEDTGQNSLFIRFGSETKGSDLDTVRNRLDRLTPILQAILVLLDDELQCDIDWSLWWDTDEMMY